MLDVKQSDYFNSLSKLIQESIMQSGTKFNNESELRTFVSNLKSTGR